MISNSRPVDPRNGSLDCPCSCPCCCEPEDDPITPGTPANRFCISSATGAQLGGDGIPEIEIGILTVPPRVRFPKTSGAAVRVIASAEAGTEAGTGTGTGTGTATRAVVAVAVSAMAVNHDTGRSRSDARGSNGSRLDGGGCCGVAAPRERSDPMVDWVSLPIELWPAQTIAQYLRKKIENSDTVGRRPLEGALQDALFTGKEDLLAQGVAYADLLQKRAAMTLDNTRNQAFVMQ